MSELEKVSQGLAKRERIAGIVWLIVGIMQICSIFGFFAGIWNIYAAFTRFKQAKAVEKPWRGIVNTYDKWLGRLIKNFVVGIFVGLFIGCVPSIPGYLYDIFVIRGYVMKHKDVYAQAGL